MDISEEMRAGLGVALNEATWFDMSLDMPDRRVELTLEIFSLPHGGEPASRTIGLVLAGVGRVAASLREGRWDDVSASVVPLTASDLPQVVQQFGGVPIYGWEFIDSPNTSWDLWHNRLSVDARLSETVSPHVIELFQAGEVDPPRHLDVRIWFESMIVLLRDGSELPLDEFVGDGVRWWDAMYGGDRRTAASGIFAASGATHGRQSQWFRRTRNR